VSSVWGTQYRLLEEHLEQFADRLSASQPPESPVLTEHTVRLLAAALILVRQHHINKRGQCRYCGWSRWGWRFWHRRPRCTVYQTLNVVLRQSLDVVWWQLLDSLGQEPR